MSDPIVYGISLAVVGAMLIAIVRYFWPVDEKWLKVGAAGWAVLAYLLVTNLSLLEGLVPSLPVWLPQVLTVVLVFGASLGLAPGETTKRFWYFVKRQ